MTRVLQQGHSYFNKVTVPSSATPCKHMSLRGPFWFRPAQHLSSSWADWGWQIPGWLSVYCSHSRGVGPELRWNLGAEMDSQLSSRTEVLGCLGAGCVAGPAALPQCSGDADGLVFASFQWTSWRLRKSAQGRTPRILSEPSPRSPATREIAASPSSTAPSSSSARSVWQVGADLSAHLPPWASFSF